MTIETKNIGGHVLEVKEVERNGVKIGVVEGYIATWDIDRGDWFGVKDQFVKGAFVDSIREHKDAKRQIRLKDHHGRTVGGFPIDNVKEDSVGLFGIGEINLEVQQGREAYSLAKQGVLTDFSIGFSIAEYSINKNGDLRTIQKGHIWEGSIVDEPMNPFANITAVKSMGSIEDLPIHTDKEYVFDQPQAYKRLLKFSQENAGLEIFNNGFIYKDFSAEGIKIHQIQIADVVDGKMVLIPEALKKCLEFDDETIAGVIIPENDREAVIKTIEKQLARISEPSPFGQDEKQYFLKEDIEGMDARQLERVLKKTGAFSKPAVMALASRLKSAVKIDEPQNLTNTNNLTGMLSDIKNMTQNIKKTK